MIPCKIHYCWFGGNPLPDLARKCIDSWKKYFPDYEIIEWNENNFDVNIIRYTSEAYKAKKYAFVSDYARFWILYKYGGLYFDTDVEIIKNMDDIIQKGPFMGCEKDSEFVVAPGLGLGSTPGLPFYKEVLDYYSHISFINDNGSYNQVTVVDHVTSILVKNGLKKTNDIQCCAGIYIYPTDFFCPMDQNTGELLITNNTRSIHHYMASWITKSQKLYQKIEKVFGIRFAQFLSTNLKRLGVFK